MISTPSTAGSVSEKQGGAQAPTFQERMAHCIRERPLQSAIQATLFGYALHFIPLRSLIATAARLAVPAVFIAGVFQLSKSVQQQVPSK